MKNKKNAVVLIVEDDEDSRDALSQLLNFEGYRSVCVSNGQEALEYLGGHPRPDLILLDMVMPVMSGAEFRRRQLQNSSLRSIPTISLTAAQEREALKEFPGPIPFLSKPVDFERLMTVVREYC